MEPGSTYHVRLDVRGAMRWPKRELARLLRHEDGRLMTADEAWNALADCLAAGVEALPVGECDNFDPKTGCRGHRRAAAPSPGAPDNG